MKKRSTVRRSIKDLKKEYDQGSGIVALAEGASYSPYLLARLLLEDHFRRESKGTEVHIRRGSKGFDGEGNLKKKVSASVRSPALISDDRLRAELNACVSMDVHNSPFVDRIRHFIGVEYEHVLLERLRNLDVPFLSEASMRSKGFDKTPDVRLLVPVGVNGEVVNWIDSKAMFGDRETHLKNAKQMQRYVIRYGPGLVIYWFGHELGLEAQSGVLVSDRFPDSVLLPSGSLVRADRKRREQGLFAADAKPLVLTALKMRSVGKAKEPRGGENDKDRLLEPPVSKHSDAV